jgi:Mn2+/Fe2+ NRAMP family transporter
MMPLLIIFLLELLNNEKRMGDHQIGLWLNAGLVLALIF